eukprot:662559-Rhodomonas_salina.2
MCIRDSPLLSPLSLSARQACALALRDHPDVNTSWMDKFIRRYNYVDIRSHSSSCSSCLSAPAPRFAQSLAGSLAEEGA